jgi:hypothetical protein
LGAPLPLPDPDLLPQRRLQAAAGPNKIDFI